MNKSVFFTFVLLVSLFLSCKNDKKTSDDNSNNRFVSCAYIPKDEVLQNIDSIIRLRDDVFLDSLCELYKSKNFESLVFLNSKVIRHYTKFRRNSVKANKLISFTDSILFGNYLENNFLKAMYNNEKGVWFSYTHELDSALVYFNKTLEIYNKTKDKICKEKLHCYNDISIAHFYFGGSIDSARYYLEKQESCFDSTFDDHLLMYKNYYVQATIHKTLYNYSLGLTYTDLAIKELEKYNYIDSNGFALTYDLKATIEYSHLLYKESYNTSLKAISFMRTSNLSLKKQFYLSIINILSAMDSLDLSSEYIDKLNVLDPNDTNNIALTYKLKGIVDMKKKITEKAIINFKESIDLYNSVRDVDKYQYAETCYLFSDALRKLGLYDESIVYGKRAVNIYFDTISMYFDVLSKDPMSIRYVTGVAEPMTEKYSYNNTLKDKNRTENLYKLIDSLISDLYRNFDEDVILTNQSKLKYYYVNKLKFYHTIYDKSKKRKYLIEILNIFNDYKGKSLLTERVLNNSYLGINDTIGEMKRLVDEIKYKIEQKIGNQVLLNNKLNRLLKKLDAYNKNDIVRIELESSDDLLYKLENYCIKNKTIIVDYVIPTNVDGNDMGYIFISNGNISKVIQIDSVSSLLESSNSLFDLMSNYSEDITLMNKLKSGLYNKLLFFINNYKEKDLESIVIIPDRNLCKIPFELLRSKDSQILLEKYNISYGYSLQNLLLSKTEKINNHKVLVFAHSDENTVLGETLDSLSELPGSYFEAKAIKDIYKDNCKSFTGYEASKENFIKYANDYPIIHLALHGKSDEFSRFKSKIYFRNKNYVTELYPHELLKYKIKPELMVLSACETASGKLLDHESMYSVARAFYTGGAKKVISSLWELDDQSSKNIFIEFYKLISEDENISYSQALRTAKLKYLKQFKSSKKYNSYIGGLVLYN